MTNTAAEQPFVNLCVYERRHGTDVVSWHDTGNYISHRTREFFECWQAALAHASSATVKENLTVGDRVDCRVAGPWKGLCDQCSAGNYDACRYTHPAPSAEDARDAGGWREMDSAPVDKAIMGAWFGSPEYTEVAPVIYCSERGKWMNPDDMRDDEYAKPDMWHPYPVAPKHRDVYQALAAERGEA